MQSSRLTLILLLSLGSPLAFAAGDTTQQNEQWQYRIWDSAMGAWDEATDGKNWLLTLSAGAIAGPAYSGSKKTEFGPLGDLTVSHRSGVFLSSSQGIGYRYGNDDWYLNGSIGMSAGRKEKDGKDGNHNPLQGMGDIDGGAQFVFGGGYQLEKLSLSAVWQTGLAERNRGNTLNLAASYPLYDSEQASVSMNGSVLFADSRYQQRWYGVSSSQATRSGHRSYEAGAGLSEASAGLSLSVPILQNLSWVSSVQYTQLLGSAADSPLTERKGYVSGGTGFQFVW